MTTPNNIDEIILLKINTLSFSFKKYILFLTFIIFTKVIDH